MTGRPPDEESRPVRRGGSQKNIAAGDTHMMTRAADVPRDPGGPLGDAGMWRRHQAARRCRPLPGHYAGCPAGSSDPIRRCRCRDLARAERAGVRDPRRYR